MQNAKLEFSNSNFELKDNGSIFEKNIETITSENGISFGLPIVARKNSKYNLSLLNMVSSIKLTGEYIDDNGNVTTIDTTKNVKIEWTADEITQEEVNLSQEVITNKLYNIEGTNKRIVQILVKSNIVENKVPVKSTKIEIQEPQIGVKPEQVKITAKNTLATNGKTDVEFGNLIDSKYEYKQEEGKTYIEILNNADEENNISWEKNANDEIIVTYIYNEETKIVPFTSKAKSTIELYGKNETIEKENELTLENIETMGDINTLESAITNNIYKGNMYIGEETNYQTAWRAYVTYPELSNKIILQDTSVQETEQLSTYYKSTKINKVKAIDLLGEQGIIKVYNVEDLNTPIVEIKLAEETEEYITINYQTNVKQIVIETTNAVKEGKLEVLNEKAIKVLKTEKIEEISKLTSEIKLLVLDEAGNIVTTTTKSVVANLLEPETSIEVNLDKSEISNQTENTLRLTTILKSVDNSNKLFKNPIINVEFPKEITEVSLENKALLYDEELKIKTAEIVTNENGNKVLKIELEGEQTKYNTSSAQGGANIVIDLKLKADNFMANKNVELKTTCINNEGKAEKTNEIGIVSKFGILNKSSITVGDNTVEEVNKNSININTKGTEEIKITTSLINNYEETLSNMILLGTIPLGAELKSFVSVNIKNANIYYSEEENASADSESWKTEVAELNNIKSFKIVVPELTPGELTTLNYNYQLNQTELNSTESIINIKGTVGNQTKEEKLTYITSGVGVVESQKVMAVGVATNAEKISVEVTPTIGGESAVTTTGINNGQVIRYRVKVTNTSNETLNNIKIKTTIENGVYYELVEDGGSFLDSETGEMVKSHSYAEVPGVNNKEFTKDTLLAGESYEFDYQVVAYIGTGENANSFKNSISVTADNMEEFSLNDTKTIKEAEIALKLHYSSNEEPELYSDGNMKCFEIELTNLSENNLKNIPITINLPKEFCCYVDNQYYFDKECGEISVVDNQLRINVYNLEIAKTLSLYVQLETNSIPLNELESEIVLIAESEFKDVTYYSNEYRRNILQSETNLDVGFTSNKTNEILYLDTNDTITYTLTLKNNGLLGTGSLYIFDDIPYDLKVTNITAQINNGEEKEYKTNRDKNIFITDLSLDPGDNLTLTIVAELDCITKNNSEITNAITIYGSTVKEIEKQLINVVSLSHNTQDDPTTPTDPEDPVNPTYPEDPNDPTDPVDPSKPGETVEPENPIDQETEKTYSISGLAWLDENKNGIRDNNESILQGIEVVLLDTDGNVVKDKDGKEISTITTITGTYKFTNIPKGEYIVVFIYNAEKYTITKYQVEGATEEQNSDVISKQIKINNETKLVGATNIIKIENSDILNIDIGLIENAKFDLSLEKYVSKVVVTNSSESVNYDFGEETLAKIEIAAKKIASSTILVQYEIKISNDGSLTGYVNDVIDYMPKELTFDSEMNPDWYLDSEGILHNESLAKVAIEPGKTETVKLILTKTLNNNSTGTIENIAEIGTSTNLEGIKDMDSVGGNKITGEDDIGSASLIISIKTGEPVMYIGIVLASMAVIGLGIFIINKKILGNRV